MVAGAWPCGRAELVAVLRVCRRQSRGGPASEVALARLARSGLGGLGALLNGCIAIFPDDNEITRAAIREGCLSPDRIFEAFLSAVASAALAGAYMAVATTHILIPKPD